MDEKLNQIFLEWQKKPFKWGISDCCQFVIFASAKLTGNSAIIENYTTERGALRVLKKLGGYQGILESEGYTLLDNPLLARRGDIVEWLLKSDKNFVSGLAICGGEYAHAMGRDGIVLVPQDLWLKAWRYK